MNYISVAVALLVYRGERHQTRQKLKTLCAFPGVESRQHEPNEVARGHGRERVAYWYGLKCRR